MESLQSIRLAVENILRALDAGCEIRLDALRESEHARKCRFNVFCRERRAVAELDVVPQCKGINQAVIGNGIVLRDAVHALPASVIIQLYFQQAVKNIERDHIVIGCFMNIHGLDILVPPHLQDLVIIGHNSGCANHPCQSRRKQRAAYCFDLHVPYSFLDLPQIMIV